MNVHEQSDILDFQVCIRFSLDDLLQVQVKDTIKIFCYLFRSFIHLVLFKVTGNSYSIAFDRVLVKAGFETAAD